LTRRPLPSGAAGHWDESGHGECAMLKTDEFWQYAKEAILSATRAETDDERQGLLDLARTWTQAALVERHSRVGHDGTTIAS